MKASPLLTVDDVLSILQAVPGDTRIVLVSGDSSGASGWYEQAEMVELTRDAGGALVVVFRAKAIPLPPENP
jgi:hypothetical protein